MTIRKARLFLFGGYILFGIVMFLVFFYMTFPFDLLEARLLGLLEARSGCKVTADGSRYRFLGRAAWRNLKARCPKRRFGIRESGEVALAVASLDLSVAPLPLLLHRRGEIDFHAVLGGGQVSGVLTVAQADGGPAVTLRGAGEGIDLSQTGVAGRLTITGEGTWQTDRPAQGRGRLRFTLEEGRFKEIGEWTLPIGEVAFSRIEGQLSWKGGRVILEQLSAAGETIDVPSGSGNLLLRAPFDGSLVTLSLRAVPKGSLKEMAALFIQGYSGREPLKIRVSGPLRAPQILLNGKAIRL